MPHIFGWSFGATGGGGEPTGPAGGKLSGTYPNPGLAAEGVEAAAIKTEAVTTAKIKLLAVEAGQIAKETITEEKEASESTGTRVLVKEAVTAAKLAPEAVETAKIKLLAITAATLAAEAVETAKIKTAAVTKEKLSAAVQEELEPKVTEHSFAIAGEAKNEVYPGMFIKLGTHETKNLIGVEYELLEGTSVELELQKANSGKSEAAAGIAGYKVTELKAEKTTKRVASSKALANEDRLTLKCSAATGTPKGLIVTLFIESVK